MDSEVVKSKEGTKESSKRTEDELESDKSKKAESSEKKAKGSKKKSIDKHEEAEEDEAEMKKHMEIQKMNIKFWGGLLGLKDFKMILRVTTAQALPSPDYVPGPGELAQVPTSTTLVPKPVYPEFMPPNDEVLPAEEQLLPAATSPTTDSPGYVS
ncbi:hypothetical protein Tco_0179720 [Tanacetum coccineum]